jgi:prevent-host-death family protein
VVQVPGVAGHLAQAGEQVVDLGEGGPDLRVGLAKRRLLDLVHNLIDNTTMTKVNIHEAKTHLSRYLERVAEGEVIVLCKRNVPVAELRPLPGPRTTPRPVGLAKNRFTVPDDFFEPLPDDLLDAFEGRGE